jgi:hypothetical protein
MKRPSKDPSGFVINLLFGVAMVGLATIFFVVVT